MAIFQEKGWMINVERKTYYALDVAKFISAFLVVCIHTGPLLDVDATGNFILVQILARLAVPFFFVASGFLFFRKLDFKREYNDYENKAQLKHYLWRLCKIYIIWTILYLPFTYLLLKGQDGITVNSVLLYVRDFFFTGSFYHLWFLPALLVAVPVVYICLFKLGLGKTILFGFLLYLIGMAGNVYGGYLMQIPGIQSVYQAYLQVFSTTRNGLFFGVMFIAMGALFAQRTLYLKNWQVLLGFLLSAGLLFAECFALKDNGFMHDLTSMYAMLLPCMFFLFLGLLRIHLPQSKVYKTLRVLSLLIYVMHIMFVNLPASGMAADEFSGCLRTGYAADAHYVLLYIICSQKTLVFKASLCLNRRNIMLRIQQNQADTFRITGSAAG